MAICFAGEVRADDDATSSSLNAPAVPAQKKSVRRRVRQPGASRTEVGVGYLTWNEDLGARTASAYASGVASYGGIALFVEQSWQLKYWQLGANFAYGSGKAAGSVNGAVTYSDGSNRAWTAVVFEPFVRYQINAYVFLGGGLLYRHTGVTWETADTTVTLEPASKSELTGQFDFKVQLAKHWSIDQSYAPIGWRGRSQWFTNASYAF